MESLKNLIHSLEADYNDSRCDKDAVVEQFIEEASAIIQDAENKHDELEYLKSEYPE